MRRSGEDRPWFGPAPRLLKAAAPLTWEGWTVTVAFLMGLMLMRLVEDPLRRAIATGLVVLAYGAIVCLTWGDPDTGERLDWRRALWSRQAPVTLTVVLAVAAALVGTAYFAATHAPVHTLGPGRSRG